MTPLSLLAAQAFVEILATEDLLATSVNSFSTGQANSLPPLSSAQILLSSAPSNLADNNLEFIYPRLCIYASGIKNTQIEKFRSFSGQVMVIAEILASGDLVTDVDLWIHFYVEAVTEILRASAGDWGNGLSFSGAYNVEIQVPKVGGLGFVQSAKITLELAASLS